MRLSIDNKFLINSRNLHEVEPVLAEWVRLHAGQVIYAYQWEEDTYYEDWASFLKQMADSDTTINLLTKHEDELKQEMKDSVLSYCERIREQLPAVIERLFGNHPETEEKGLSDLFEGLNYLISSASLFEMESDLEDRHEAVVELSGAYEAKDFVELADLLKYDWLPWVRQYEKNLQQLHIGIS